MKNIFISQPINEKSNDKILLEQRQAISLLNQLFQENIKIIDPGYPDDFSNQLEYLAYSIHCISKANIVYFAYGWQDDKKCLIEQRCANDYDIKTIYSEFDAHKTSIGRRIDMGIFD